MSSKDHEDEIDLIEYAIDILRNRFFRFSVGQVLYLSGLRRNKQRVDLICWVAEQSGCKVNELRGDWEIVT